MNGTTWDETQEEQFRLKCAKNDSAIPEHGIPEDGIEWLQMARDQLWQRCNDYGIDLTED